MRPVSTELLEPVLRPLLGSGFVRGPSLTVPAQIGRGGSDLSGRGAHGQ